jgi:Prenyltransferase and squalene oxidase repeat
LTISWFHPRTQHVHETQKLNHACVQQLIDRQLPDGGWPFTCDTTQWAVEPTALALLALPSNSVRERDAAIRFLLRTQNANGSWPAFGGDDGGGSGFTGLVLYALNRCCAQGMVTNRAVHWLIECRGWESHWLWKWKFRTSDRHVRFDPDKFGWPWMPETASWVVPTAYSILALKHSRGISRNDLVHLRIQRGVEMLYDRICPEGGWNAGNGVVYGFPLAPHADATALALLSLLSEPPNDFITASRDWLERRAETCFAPWSLAWATIALDAFGRFTELLTARLCSAVAPAEVNDCATLAVVALASCCAAGNNAFRVPHET